MTVVAVTGSSGFLGSHLISSLSQDESIDRIIGIDIRTAGQQTPKCTFVQKDVRDPDLVNVFKEEGVDCVAHLAFIVFPIRNMKTMYDIDVEGSRNVLNATAGSNVKKLVFASSSAVYGFHPDNRIPLTEDQPMRPNPENLYGVHKALVETILTKFLLSHPDIKATVFRPCMILGPNMDNFSCQMARKLPRIITVAGQSPTLQFVHEDDVVGALHRAIINDMPGTYNLAGSGTITMDDFCRMFRKKSFPIPFRLLHAVHSVLWKLRFPGVNFNPGWLSIMRYSCIVGGEKLKNAHGLTPAYTTAEALQSYIDAKVPQ